MMSKTVIVWLIDMIWVCIIAMVFSGKLYLSGIIVYVLWIIPLLLSFIIIARDRKSRKSIFPLVAIAVFLSVLELVSWSGREKVKDYSDEKYNYVVYELNPGAMGHTSYLKNKYIIISGSDLLTVKWRIDTERTRYAEGV